MLLAQGDRDGALAAYRAGARHCRNASAPRSGQHRVAARPLGQPQQDRRRAGGAGRSRRRAGGLPCRARHSRSARAPRPRQHRVAARPLGQPRQDRRRAAARRAIATARWRPTGRRSPLPRRSPAAIPPTPSGSATSRSAITGSATCCSRRGIATARLRPTVPRSPFAKRSPAATPPIPQWQRDLIVSYVKMAEAEPTAARAQLSRALDIARTLRSEGRLAPTDAWVIDDLTNGSVVKGIIVRGRPAGGEGEDGGTQRGH